MSFCSPFIGNNLIEVPCECQVKDNVEDETEQGISDHIIIHLISEISIYLNRLRVYHRLECENKSTMRNDANSTID